MVAFGKWVVAPARKFEREGALLHGIIGERLKAKRRMRYPEVAVAEVFVVASVHAIDAPRSWRRGRLPWRCWRVWWLWRRKWWRGRPWAERRTTPEAINTVARPFVAVLCAFHRRRAAPGRGGQGPQGIINKIECLHARRSTFSPTKQTRAAGRCRGQIAEKGKTCITSDAL